MPVSKSEAWGPRELAVHPKSEGRQTPVPGLSGQEEQNPPSPLLCSITSLDWSDESHQHEGGQPSDSTLPDPPARHPQ